MNARISCLAAAMTAAGHGRIAERGSFGTSSGFHAQYAMNTKHVASGKSTNLD